MGGAYITREEPRERDPFLLRKDPRRPPHSFHHVRTQYKGVNCEPGGGALARTRLCCPLDPARPASRTRETHVCCLGGASGPLSLPPCSPGRARSPECRSSRLTSSTCLGIWLGTSPVLGGCPPPSGHSGSGTSGIQPGLGRRKGPLSASAPARPSRRQRVSLV